ncbi:MAG: hypothetical protein Q7R48_01565, partial [bacterium]|nr:hypothetical protein [bacterium]
PGIYLFAGANCTGDVRAYSGNTASLGDFDNKAQSLKIIPSTTTVSTPYSAEELDGLTPIPPPRSSTIITNKLGVILFQKDGAQNDGAVFLGGDMSYVSQPEARCIPITNACSGSQEPYCVKGANEIVGDVSSLKVFNQYLLTDVPSGSQTTQLAKPPSGDGVTLFGNYDFNEQDPGSRAGEQQIHCGPINATSASGSDLKIGKPLWVNGEDGSNNNRGIGAETLNSGDNISNLQCTKLLKDHQWTSSIRIDGDYIAVLFRSDGRAEVFKAPGDYRLRDNHVGDDSARYLLVIPIKQR